MKTCNGKATKVTTYNAFLHLSNELLYCNVLYFCYTLHGTVLQAPFLTVVPPATPDQTADCDKAFKLINFCPTATDLDLKTLGMNGIYAPVSAVDGGLFQLRRVCGWSWWGGPAPCCPTSARGPTSSPCLMLTQLLVTIFPRQRAWPARACSPGRRSR